jgi:hypothetical protein
MARQIPIGAFLAITGDGAVNEARIDLSQGLVVDT